MVTSTEPLIFQHCPLPDAKTHIRLLKVLSVVKTRAIPVHCELMTFHISELPRYRAISYTWGDDKAPPASILVNGQQMSVRFNCEYALGQTSQHSDDGNGDLLIWIDSICINQLDNDEKSTQVSMMGDIFNTATQVLACVGAHGDDSEFLYEFLRGEEPRFRLATLSILHDYWDASVHVSILMSKELIAWRWKHPRSVRMRLCKALANFLARPYFHRVWVYQELFLGRNIDVYCGEENLPISWILWTSSMVSSWLRSAEKYYIFWGIWHPVVMWTLFPKITEAMPMLLAGCDNQPPLMHLSIATAAIAARSCQDPRDKVYGVLSIIRPAESHHFRPDYTKDRLDLAIEVLQKTNAEGIDGTPDFDISLASYAKRVGINLNLNNDPSEKLVSEVELRRSSTNLQAMRTDLTGMGDEVNGSVGFVGSQIFSQNGQWKFENQDKWFLRHGLKFMLPRMEKRLQSDKIPDASVGIYLPPEAQEGDWLLIPRSHHWETRVSWDRIAFLGRRYDSRRFEIVGKALISAMRWVSTWDKKFRRKASAFRFHCHPADLLVLLHLCKWEDLRSIKKWEDSESYDAYFQTRFCGERFSSYAVGPRT